MKVVVKQSNETVFLQKCDDNSDKLNKLVGYLTRLPVGDRDVVELDCNGHTMTIKTGDLDISVIARLANGIIVKNAAEALIKPAQATQAEVAS